MRGRLQAKRIRLIGHVPVANANAELLREERDRRRHRIFLLSPANISGERAKLIWRQSANFPLAQQLRREGVPLGEVFSFISGLYFRGKLAYARAYANPPPGIPGVVVITSVRGLMSPDRIVTMEELIELSSAPVDAKDSRYRLPLEADARILREAMGVDCDAVLLGSIATPKYLDPLGGVFSERLLFPADFVGRGDMSRGSMLLRCVREGVQLRYSAVTSLSKSATPSISPNAKVAKPTRLTRSSKEPTTDKSGRRDRRRRPVTTVAAPNPPEAVIFVGIQASGKSTFYHQRFAATHIRINLDSLKTREKERQLLRDCIAEKKSFVVDNTNPLPSDRARYIEPAQAAGFRAIAYFFDSPFKEAIARNRSREGREKIPVPAMVATLRKLRQPTKMEGFDALFEVRIVDGGTDKRFIAKQASLGGIST